MKFPPIMVTNSAKSPTVNEPSRMSGAARARSMAVVTTTVLAVHGAHEAIEDALLQVGCAPPGAQVLEVFHCALFGVRHLDGLDGAQELAQGGRDLAGRLPGPPADGVDRPPSALVKPKTSTPGSNATTVISGSIVAIT